jgi:hypothetical protein
LEGACDEKRGGGNCSDGANDVFGCGNLGATPAESCSPLNRFSHDFCSQLMAPWTRGGDSQNEANNVTTAGADAGGVLCCKTAD